MIDQETKTEMLNAVLTAFYDLANQFDISKEDRKKVSASEQNASAALLAWIEEAYEVNHD